MSWSGLEKELDKGFFDEEAAQHNTPITIIVRTKAKATGSKNNNNIQKTAAAAAAAATSITDLPLL
jgi:alpha/beta superfamily hydrolase